VEQAADEGQAVVIGSHEITMPPAVTGGYELIEVMVECGERYS
jgi:hypothetical protein